jgi:hypothetical protein
LFSEAGIGSNDILHKVQWQKKFVFLYSLTWGFLQLAKGLKDTHTHIIFSHLHKLKSGNNVRKEKPIHTAPSYVTYKLSNIFP